MSDQQTSTSSPDFGKRHPLLVQRRLNEQVFWPCILILGLCAGLLIWNPTGLERYRSTLEVVLVVTGLVLIFSFVLRLRSYVQCRSDVLWVQLPFYHLAIPYPAIQATRITELYRIFPVGELRWGRQRFLEPILGKTVVIVELDEQPLPSLSRRLWLGWAMVCPNETGLIVSVDDWIAFRTALDESIFRNRRPPA